MINRNLNDGTLIELFVVIAIVLGVIAATLFRDRQ
jgi:hypothetical protein